ncbi:MAG: TonB-dependent receptor [Chitinophagaceae bacterium]|nr:MAG: TonB-dependent receptor [Chitinophagaceae bacterium]
MKRFLLIGWMILTMFGVKAQTNKGEIEGIITTPDGHAVSNVNVEIKGKKLYATTNEKGYFIFKEVPYGDYILIYSFEGETSKEIAVTVPPINTDAQKYNLSLNSRELKEVIVRIGGSLNQGRVSIGKSGLAIMDMPQAVTIIGQSTIENQQAQRLSDVVKNVNGVYLGGTRASTQETFYARGYNLGSTNTFKNGFRVNSGAMPEMSSIESVEVLKGSGALLYGNVAPGGIINMVTKKPKFYFGGSVSMRVGSYDLYKPTIDVYGPINKKIAYRLNGSYEKANSYRDIVHSERFYINPSLLFKLSDKTKLTIQGDYLQHDFTPDFGIGTMSDKANVYGGKKITPVSRNTFFGAPWQYAKTKQATASVELTHQLNQKWEIAALAGYQNYERDYLSLERLQADVNGKWKRPLGKSYSEEDYYTAQVNLTGNVHTGKLEHRLLFGADVEKSIAVSYQSNLPSNTIYDSINLLDPSMYVRRTDIPKYDWISSTENPTSRFGAYIQDLISISKHFKVLAGLRWSFQQADQSKKKTFSTNASSKTGAIKIDKAFSPRLGLLYQPSENTTFFASYANSFTPNSGLDIDSASLKPSIIDQFELGIKKDFLNGLLSTNITLYKIINNNVSQAILFFKDGSPVLGNTNLRELTGQTTSDGIEFDLKSQPLKGWDILAGYSFNNMRYTKTTGKQGSYVEGIRLVNNPAHTANATTFYTFQKGGAKGFKMGAGVYYVGKRNAGWSPTYSDNNGAINNRLFEVGEFVTVDASMGYSYKKLSLMAKLSNITNTFNYYVHENYSINPIPPRSFVITASFKL